ncbi:MAG: TonB-dependent receptor plug domain-containing protein [Mariniphaga sp.]|nr:TonB-dependent receptor plug domain-containing protein [Mariniphaga sp.]
MKKLALHIMLVTFCSILLSNNLYSQERTIFGSVTTFNVIPIINAEVTIKSSKEIIFTDTLGYFEVTCNVKDKIKISADGFFTRNIKLKADDDTLLIDLRIQPQNSDLAINSGHIKERDMLRASNSLSNKDEDFSTYVDMYELLLNRFPNVQVFEGGRVIIGSPSSVSGSNYALVVIDGVISDYGNLGMLSPQDVKNIEILKPSESSIYGYQGGNGVVRITTNRGGEF